MSDSIDNTVLEMFKGRCALNPAHVATVIHHIIPRSVFSVIPTGHGYFMFKDDHVDMITNLAPLCVECHGKIHREGTKKYREILKEAHENIA